MYVKCETYIILERVWYSSVCDGSVYRDGYLSEVSKSLVNDTYTKTGISSVKIKALLIVVGYYLIPIGLNNEAHRYPHWDIMNGTWNVFVKSEELLSSLTIKKILQYWIKSFSNVINLSILWIRLLRIKPSHTRGSILLTSWPTPLS